MALKSMAIGTFALACGDITGLNSAFASNEDYFKKLDSELERIVSSEGKFAFDSDITKLKNLIQENPDLFLSWYKNQALDLTKEKNKNERYEKKEQTLHALGHKAIYDYLLNINGCTLPEEKLPKFTADSLESYEIIIKNSGSKFNNYSREMSKRLIGKFNEFKGKKLEGYKELGEKMFSLYLVALDSHSPSKDLADDVKTELLSVAVDLSGVYENDREKIDKLALKLTNTFFVDLKDSLDKELFDYFIDHSISNPTVGYPVSDMDNYLIYKLIDLNLDYFTKCIESEFPIIEKYAQELVQNGFDIDPVKPAGVEDALALIRYLCALQYLNLKLQFSYDEEDYEMTQARRSHTQTDIPSDLYKKIFEWSDNLAYKFAKPLLDTMDNKTASVQCVRGERYVKTRELDRIHETLNFLIPFDSCFGRQVVKKVEGLLKTTQDPFLREKYYEISGETLWTLYPKDETPLCVPLLREGFVKEKSPQSIRAIGSSLSRSFGSYTESDAAVIKLRSIIEGFNKGTSKYQDIIAFDHKTLTPAQAIVLDAMRIVLGDFDKVKELLPGRTFPPPNSDGTRSKENIEDGAAFRQLYHNAFLLLAYSATQSPFRDYHAIAYKEAIIGFLEKRLLKNFYAYPDLNQLGEKVAAMIEMYSSYHSDPVKSPEFVKLKINYLQEILFNGQNSVFKDYEEACKETLERELFWKEADKIERKWLKETEFQRNNAKTKEEKDKIDDRNPINRLIVKTNPEHDNLMREIRGTESYKDGLKKITRQILDDKQEFAYSFLNSAPSENLAAYRTHLIGDRLKTPIGSVEFIGLGLSPYDEEEAFKRIYKPSN